MILLMFTFLIGNQGRSSVNESQDHDPFVLLNSPSSASDFRNKVVICDKAPKLSVCLSVPEYKYVRKREKQLEYLLQNPQKVEVNDYALETGIAGFFTGALTFSLLCVSKVICR